MGLYLYYYANSNQSSNKALKILNVNKYKPN